MGGQVTTVVIQLENLIIAVFICILFANSILIVYSNKRVCLIVVVVVVVVVVVGGAGGDYQKYADLWRGIKAIHRVQKLHHTSTKQ